MKINLLSKKLANKLCNAPWDIERYCYCYDDDECHWVPNNCLHYNYSKGNRIRIVRGKYCFIFTFGEEVRDIVDYTCVEYKGDKVRVELTYGKYCTPESFVEQFKKIFNYVTRED